MASLRRPGHPWLHVLLTALVTANKYKHILVCILLGLELYGGVGTPSTHHVLREERKGWVSRHLTPNLAPRHPDNCKLEESERARSRKVNLTSPVPQTNSQTLPSPPPSPPQKETQHLTEKRSLSVTVDPPFWIQPSAPESTVLMRKKGNQSGNQHSGKSNN